jgi:peptidoglycan/xylan/chitin deacetylase (PgdA/CDA1 family)
MDENKKNVVVFFDLEGPERPHNFSLENTLGKIIKILKDRNIDSVFNTSGIIVNNYPDLIKQIHDDGNEISSHGYNHEDFSQLNKEMINKNLKMTEDAIKKTIGIPPIGFRAPKLILNKELNQILIDRGYKWVSNMYFSFKEVKKMNKNKNIIRQILGIPNDIIYQIKYNRYPKEPFLNGILEIPMLSSADGAFLGYLPPSQDSLESRLDYAYESFIKQYRYSQSHFNLNFHPWLIGSGNRIKLLEDLLDFLVGEKVNFVTCQQIYKEFSREKN